MEMLQLFAMASGFVFSLLCFIFTCKNKNQGQNKTNLHGSMGWPFLGETHAYLKPHASTSIGNFLQDHSSRYGKVFKSHLFGSPTVVSCDHELNTFVLQNEEKLFECSYPKSIHGVLGKLSMLVVVGERHKKLRSATLGLTNQWKHKPEILQDIDKQIVSLMKSWKGKHDLIFVNEAKKLTFNVIAKQILSLRPEDPQAMKLLEAYLTFMAGLVSFPLAIPGTPYARAIKARARINIIVKTIVEKRRLAEIKDCFDGRKDFLDALLSNENLSDEERVSLVLDLLLAGHETTSLLIALSVYFLGSAPLALHQLKEEHQAISEKRRGEDLTMDDYKQMEFTQCVINEVLRCGNVVKFLHRRALKDVNFKGYLIPSGWKVLPILSSVHLDPSNHDKPSDFSPWRWIQDEEKVMKRVAPFGGGIRLCPGADLARVKTSFFLHHFVLNFSWKFQGEDQPMAFPYIEFERGLPISICRTREDDL